MIGLGLGIGLSFGGGGGGGGAWSPATPSGLVALFDSRVGVTATGGLVDGNEVTAWADQSGNGRNVAENIALSVSYATTGLSVPALKFSGVNSGGMKYTAANILTAGSARTILFAGKNLGTSKGTGAIFAARVGDHAQASTFALVGGVQYYHGDFTTYGGQITPQSTLVDSPFSSAHVYTGAGNVPTVQVNGTGIATDSVNQGTEDGATGFMVGGMTGPAQYSWNGLIWMVAVYDNALGSTDLAAWQAYASAQFGTP